MRDLRDEIVLVTGATGLVGVPLVRHLLREGYRVRALLRDPARSAAWPSHPNLEFRVGDLLDGASIERAVAGVGWVVHLAALKRDEAQSARVNAGGALSLAAACKRAGVKLVVHVSTQSVRLRRKGIYGRTKEAAEQAFRATMIPTTTLRPSVVYTDLACGILGTLAATARLPIVPVIGAGSAGFHPIHAEDLAVMIERAAQRRLSLRGSEEAAGDPTYDVGGPDRVTVDEMLTAILELLGKKRLRVHIPGWMALVVANLLRILPRPPLTRSNVYGALEDLPMEVTRAARDFETTPIGFPAGLTRSLRAEPSASAPAEAHEVAADPGPERAEADLLFCYIFAARKAEWRPDTVLAENYARALRGHAISREHRLDDRIHRHRALLARLDALTRLFWPRCTLQKKISIAAALMECHPDSAAWLLPRDRTRRAAIGALSAILARSALKIGAAMPLLLFPGFVRRNAGLA